jgi:hypothetical protein
LNRGGLADALGAATYATLALVPRFPWLDNTAPAPVTSISVTTQTAALRTQWTPSAGGGARWWLVQWRTSAAWHSQLVWGGQTTLDIPFTGSPDRADIVAVTALDASMNASATAIWRATS